MSEGAGEGLRIEEIGFDCFLRAFYMPSTIQLVIDIWKFEVTYVTQCLLRKIQLDSTGEVDLTIKTTFESLS